MGGWGKGVKRQTKIDRSKHNRREKKRLLFAKIRPHPVIPRVSQVGTVSPRGGLILKKKMDADSEGKIMRTVIDKSWEGTSGGRRGTQQKNTSFSVRKAPARYANWHLGRCRREGRGESG